MAVTETSGSLGQVQRVADSLQRSIRHAESEYVVPFSTEIVMATVSSPESLRWSDDLVWIAPRFGGNGSLALEAATDRAGVTAHYEWVKGAGERDRYDLIARLSTDWWVIWDSEWRGVSPFTGERVETEAFSLHFTDGDGISGEMTSLRLRPPVDQSHAERVQLFKDYFAAAEANDVERLVSLFSPAEYMGTAVRRYFGPEGPELAFLPDLADLRRHYEDVRDAVTVTGVSITNWYIKDWYLFAEVCWSLETRSGDRIGMSTAEVLVLASDGLISGRLGYGTRPEPLPA
ncbi:hypothetical protein GCM10009836_36610 [Pseudonocardia ailaonensis]|uniref:SnoaL-like domain-containing protein n=1 Tax=Pseudonocardia ailaonensis TaxID=367279 RepID=A0ABN2N564_9PSEU